MRQKDKKLEYFNINEWKYMEYKELSTNDEDFFAKEDFADKGEK